jgi:sialate O-acetylesterase
MRHPIFWCALLLAALSAAWGNVKLPNMFSDNMVLQRNKPIAVFGTAAPGEAITMTLDDATAKAKADADGAWSVALPARAAGENLTLTVAGANTLTLKNLIMGDVWVCGGQSNMEFNLGGSLSAGDDVKIADLPKIRRIKLDHVTAAAPAGDFSRNSGYNSWLVCTPQTCSGFTAVGFYFAREIHLQTGVPIGIIDSNWGGTPIENWINAEGAAAVTEMADLKKTYDTAYADYLKRLPVQIEAYEAWIKDARGALAAGKAVPPMPAALEIPRPFGMYHAMIAPWTRLPIAGAIWYQGESNGGDGDIYMNKMRALIGGWRAAWKQGDFPFYFVQLAAFYGGSYKPENDTPAGGEGYARIRMAQTKTLAVPHTGMACAIDVGDATDIHPRNKFDVGKRLALWALKNDYGKADVVVSGPIFKEAKVDGNKIRISFDYLGGGLMVGKKVGRNPVDEVKDGKLARFAIAGEDKKFVWADAVIDGDTVVVSSAQVPNPVAVRYAYAAFPGGANLYNKAGLPAVPFRTDSW